MQKAIFSTVIFACLSISGWGQVVSPLGRFEVDFAKGCAPLTVTVTNISGNTNALYLFDGDVCDPSSPNYDAAACTTMTPSVVTQHTYNDPGIYSIVEFDLNEVPREDVLMIEVLPSQPPEFNVTLCNNYGAFVNITDTYYDRFQIDFGDGSPPISTTGNYFHNYGGNGTYTIMVNGYFNNGPPNCGSGSSTISTMNSLIPAIFSEVEVINQGPNGQIDLKYQLGSNNIEYKLQGSVNGTANFKNMGPITGSARSFYNMNTRDSIYCFRLVVRDQCTDTETYSNTICSNRIEVLAQNGQNQVNWNTVVTPEFNRYQVDKDGSPFGSPINISTIQGVTDNDVLCNVLYCYQVTTVNNDGGRSVSVQRCVNGINNLPPPKITYLTGTVEGSSIVLDWNLAAPINFYRVFRSVNNGPFEPIGQGTILPFVDTNLRPQLNTYCYYIIYQNFCGRQSEPSDIACAIMLAGSNPDNQNYALNWTPYSGWENGIADYQVEIMNEKGILVGPPISLGANATSYLDPITNNRQISQYRIVAVSNDSIPLRSYSNIIKADIPLQIFVPNSFTPNNDGLNDTFTSKGLFIQEFTMEIYNRWGELLFHTSDLEDGWDGVFKGSLSPEDTYVFKISATDPNGRVVVENGTVNLLRKDY